MAVTFLTNEDRDELQQQIDVIKENDEITEALKSTLSIKHINLKPNSNGDEELTDVENSMGIAYGGADFSYWYESYNTHSNGPLITTGLPAQRAQYKTYIDGPNKGKKFVRLYAFNGSEAIWTVWEEVSNKTDLDTSLSNTSENAVQNKVITEALGNVTPSIGSNGNWFIGNTDTGIAAQGPRGPQGFSGVWTGSGDPPEGYDIQIDLTDNETFLVPVRGVDYWTEADKEEIKTETYNELQPLILSQMQQTLTFVNSIEECTDPTKLYVLPDGYIYACIKKTVEESVTPNFTNQIPISQDIDSTEPFGGTGYMTGNYLTSASPFYKEGAVNDWVTGCIPYTIDKPIYIKGASFTTASHDRMYFFVNKSQRVEPAVSGSNIETYFTIEQLDVDYYKLTPINGAELSTDTQYVRMGFTTGTPSEVIITVNEEITYTTMESVTPNFTNQIPISTDTDGTVYNGDGFAENMYLSEGVPKSRNGIDCSGFIPIGCGSSSSASGEQVLRMANITAAQDASFRFALYTEDKTFIEQLYGSNIPTSGWGDIQIPYEVDTNGNVVMFDLTAISAAMRDIQKAGEMAFIRICSPNIDNNSILTVNEEITYSTTEDGTTQEWVNTGLAFVPADYEDRIIDLENDTANLKSDVTDLKIFCKTGEVVSENVITEVSNLIDKAMSREDTRLLRFLISSDAHHKPDHELITKGTKELCQAHGEILKLIGVDFVASLGDTTWGSSASDNATVLEEAKAFNKMMLPNIRGQKQIWTEGNHETGMLTNTQIQALIYSHNKDLVQNNEQWIDGYGYMDFPNQKVRVICLNTDQATGNDSSGVSDVQLKWLAETALNMDDKTDWSVITMGHHPISFNNITLMKNCAYVIEAFILGSNFSFTTNGGTEINIDYSNKNCQYVAHFHGHAHAYSVVKMQKRLDSGEYAEFDAYEICIPNACYGRNNQYKDNGTYTERYSTEITYSKEDIDGKRTSFNLITVCLDSKKIYADNYGVGIDREISY